MERQRSTRFSEKNFCTDFVPDPFEATIGGARAYLAIRDAGQEGILHLNLGYGGRLSHPDPRRGPCKAPLSEEISKGLKKRGFKFVGPVIVHAWMQAFGLVNDHTSDCFRRTAVHTMVKQWPR